MKIGLEVWLAVMLGLPIGRGVDPNIVSEMQPGMMEANNLAGCRLLKNDDGDARADRSAWCAWCG